MAKYYTNSITDGATGNVYYDLPKRPVLPSEPEKYIAADWHPHYTWFKLAHHIYADVEQFYILLAANGLTSPFDTVKRFRFLRPEFVGEIQWI